MQLPDIAPHDVTRNLTLMTPSRDRAFKPAGKEKGRAQDLFQEFGDRRDRELAICHAVETHQLEEA